MQSNKNAISVKGLRKSYGNFTALVQVDLEVKAGEIFGFLGPNGAGKTTTIRCMLDLIRPSGGTIEVFGIDPQRDSVAVRALIGYLPGELNLDGNMTAGQILHFWDRLRGGKSDWAYVDELCQRLDLETRRPIRNFSKGNKQKIGVVQAFMHHPPLLLLDEPTSGLDPLMQKQVLQMVAEARQGGATVFFSSHVLSEVQAISDRVAIVRRGEVVETAKTKDLLRRNLRHVSIDLKTACPREVLDNLHNVEVLSVDGGKHYRLKVSEEFDELIAAVAPYRVFDIRVAEATLEEIFLAFYEPQPANVDGPREDQ